MFDFWGLEWGQTMACVKSGVVFPECRTTISVSVALATTGSPVPKLTPNMLFSMVCFIFGDWNGAKRWPVLKAVWFSLIVAAQFLFLLHSRPQLLLSPNSHQICCSVWYVLFLGTGMGPNDGLCKKLCGFP
jgi:hypothetical protein